jgi:hypothetical protein
MEGQEYYSTALAGFLAIAHRVSEDVAAEVEHILKEGLERPLEPDETIRLFRRVATTIRDRAVERDDAKTATAIQKDLDRFLAQMMDGSETSQGEGSMVRSHTVKLLENHNGVKVAHVIPRPWFHGKEISMLCGYIRTKDIHLWDENVRLDIHIGQFKEKYGRNPAAQELLDIMLNHLQMPGFDPGDQFEIVELARSVAINGVRKPPIIDIDGTLLDGNRRVAACNYILNNDEFDSEQKKRAEHIFVWQLTPDATDDDRRKVVVSLNFEDDCKQQWPEYVKARKVFEEWQAMLMLEIVKPGPQRQAAMKKELSQKYALGPDTTVVNRYLKMVEWANDFEDYHVEEKNKDKYAVKHTSSEYFQYFEELSKGAKPGGVAYSLNQDEAYRRTVFDLLYDGKFRNWSQIRKLGQIADNEEARERLRMARDEQDIDEAKTIVEEAISIADTKRADKRSLGANTRIETFVKWLEELPVKAFRDEIRPENLRRLLDALALVRSHIEQALDIGVVGK